MLQNKDFIEMGYYVYKMTFLKNDVEKEILCKKSLRIFVVDI